MPITLEARRDYVEGVVPLSFWLARKLSREGLPLHEALSAKTPLYRLTSLYDGHHHPANPDAGWRDERWEELLTEWDTLYARHRDDPGSEAIERAGLERLRPLLEARLEQDVREWPKPEDRPFGFFSYNASPKEVTERQISLHLANVFAPESPFAALQVRASELARLLDDAEAKYPGLQKVYCGSWLNSFQPFLDFFPPAWSASAQPRILVYSQGWWGQFTDRKGAYQKKNGEHLRRTGAFPFVSLGCTCSVPAIKGHLHAHFGIEFTA